MTEFQDGLSIGFCLGALFTTTLAFIINFYLSVTAEEEEDLDD